MVIDIVFVDLPFVKILPHAYQDSPYVDILGWLQEEDVKRTDEFVRDELKRRKESFQVNQEKKRKARADVVVDPEKQKKHDEALAKMKADYWMERRRKQKRENELYEVRATARAEFLHRLRNERPGVCRRMINLAKASDIVTYPVLPEHDDPMQRRDPYL